MSALTGWFASDELRGLDLAPDPKCPHQLKERYQAEFQNASHKSKPVQAAEGQIEQLREELSKARKEKRDAKERGPDLRVDH
jgi:hypothetical protein